MNYLCHVTLSLPNSNNQDIDCNEDASYLDQERKSQRSSDRSHMLQYLPAICGNRTTCGIVVNDPIDGTPGLFFIFPDISVRATGLFRLRCQAVDLFKYFPLTKPVHANSTCLF